MEIKKKKKIAIAGASIIGGISIISLLWYFKNEKEQGYSSLSAVIRDPFAVPRKISSTKNRFRRSGERW